MTTEQRHTITLEDFKLIKTFYPAFQRAQGIMSNDIIIDWNQLMPVVEKIEKIWKKKFKYDFIKIKGGDWPKDQEYMKVIAIPLSTSINEAYKAVVEFIKWYNSQAEYKR